jgi:AraC-like DNA-binding protein/quercetin dioxygenase-like cupin family protein
VAAAYALGPDTTDFRMSQKTTKEGRFEDLAWLLDVTESRQPLTETSPIWVRRATIAKGPHTPHPERHPYCEICMVLQGRPGISIVERERAECGAGELLLLGPGIPHRGVIGRFPFSFITVYFLPWVLVELGPESDGVRILRRFTAQQPAARRVVRLPPKQRAEFRRRFEEIYREFSQSGFGREVRLRTLLLEILVRLLRWEQSLGRNIGGGELEINWRPILQALNYLRAHYTTPIYANDMARAAGLSESRLKSLFQHALGISWVKYLQGYRIHRAAALLNEGGHNVTEAALAVGFESLSHFNVTFRSFMGVSPKDYGRSPVIELVLPCPQAK